MEKIAKKAAPATEKKQGHVKSATSKKLFSSFFEKNRLSLSLSVFLMAISSTTGVIVSLILGSVIDAMVQGSADILRRAAILSAIFLPAVFLIDSLTSLVKAKFVHKGIKQYKDAAFAMLSKKGIGAFSSENTGGYLSALTNDAATIEENYLNRSILLVLYVLMFIFALSTMIYYSPLLTLIVMLLSLAPIIATLLMGGGLSTREKRVSDMNEGFTSRVKDLLGGFSVIKGFKAEKQAAALFADDNARTENAKQNRRGYAGVLNALSQSAGGLVQFGICIIGAMLTLRGSITAGTVIMFVNLCNFVIQPIRAVPEYFASRQAAKGLVYKLAEKLDANQTEAGEAIVSLENGIELNKLSFSYDDDTPVLKNLSFRFESGKKYALVGFSGSGKTTLLNLLMGAHKLYGGSATVGGTEISGADSGSLYSHVSLIDQNVFLFDDTIQNNITMFSEFPKAAVDSAIKRSGLERVISERGEGYRCGENGVNLSGGERQRISIARALIKNASVLLVDEATSALDNETASLVSNEILSLNGITGIVVTHRLEASLLKRYDEILMLKNGTLAESGSFDELMEKKGQFYALYTVQ